MYNKYKAIPPIKQPPTITMKFTPTIEAKTLERINEMPKHL